MRWGSRHRLLCEELGRTVPMQQMSGLSAELPMEQPLWGEHPPHWQDGVAETAVLEGVARGAFRT
eukprot:7419174-Alexandrium_andersonii.AAC.1